MLPFDVANVTQSGHLGVVIQYVWQVLYAIIAIFVVIIIPFSIFYYEAQDPSIDWRKRYEFFCCFHIITITITITTTIITITTTIIIIIFLLICINPNLFQKNWKCPEKTTFSILIQLKWGLIITVVIVVVTVVVLGATYWWLGQAEIPYKLYISPMRTTSNFITFDTSVGYFAILYIF